MNLFFNHSKFTASSGISLYLIINVFFLYIYNPTPKNHRISDLSVNECSYVFQNAGGRIDKGGSSNNDAHAKCCLSIISEFIGLEAEQIYANHVISNDFGNVEFIINARQIIMKSYQYLLHSARAPPIA